MTVTVLLWLEQSCIVSPPLSFGSLFKRKEKKSPDANRTDKFDKSPPLDTITRAEGSETDFETFKSNNISISDALNLLEKWADEKVGDLSRDLIPIKQSLENTLLSIGKLAEEMENEKVKVEDEKFKPSVESSRRILASSLKKEVSSDFPTPTSIPEAKRFQESLQSLMERFGDVSGSHSKLLTTFMKKKTGKIKGEFDIISSLEKRTNKIMDRFERDRQPVENSIAVLNKTSQMTDSIHQQRNELQNLIREISRLEIEDKELVGKLVNLEGSSNFESTSKTLLEIELAQEEENEFHRQLSDLFSPVTRALTKYSYGTSKVTSRRLQILMEAPWKIFEQTKEQKEDTKMWEFNANPSSELEIYKALLVEVHKATNNGKITLKDSDKTVRHFELIIESLPGLKRKSELIYTKLRSLEQKKDHSIISLAEELRRKVRDTKAAIENRRVYLERLENEIKDKNHNLQNMARNSEECLLKVTGKNYTLDVPIA